MQRWGNATELLLHVLRSGDRPGRAPSEPYERVEESRGPTLVDHRAGALHPRREGFGAPADPHRGAGVRRHDRALGVRAAPFAHLAEDPRVLERIASPQLVRA